MKYDLWNHSRVKALFEVLAGDVGTQHANQLISDAEFLAAIREAIGKDLQTSEGAIDMNTGLQY